jgi:MFS family permease
MDFMCEPKWKIAIVGFMFLFGIVIGCVFVTPLGDKYGRRPLYLSGLILNLAIVIALIFTKT